MAQIKRFRNAREKRIGPAIDRPAREWRGENLAANAFAGFENNDVEISSLCCQRECCSQTGDAGSDNDDTSTVCH